MTKGKTPKKMRKKKNKRSFYGAVSDYGSKDISPVRDKFWTWFLIVVAIVEAIYWTWKYV